MAVAGKIEFPTGTGGAARCVYRKLKPGLGDGEPPTTTLARGWDDGARPRQVMTKPMTKTMTKAAAPIEQLARRRLWAGP
jgi:hypothetical protein